MEWTKEAEETCQQMLEEGLGYREIGNALGCVWHSIRYKVKKEGWKRRRKEWSLKETSYLFSLIDQGLSIDQISKNLDRSIYSIRAHLQRNETSIQQGKHTLAEAARTFGVAPLTVRGAASRRKLEKIEKPGRKLLNDDDMKVIAKELLKVPASGCHHKGDVKTLREWAA